MFPTGTLTTSVDFDVASSEQRLLAAVWAGGAVRPPGRLRSASFPEQNWAAKWVLLALTTSCREVEDWGSSG